MSFSRSRTPNPQSASAYTAALTLLSRRELSESQVRQRLARKGHDGDEIDAAVARLKADGAIDDARVAGAMARTQTSVKRRGRMRVQQEMQRAGLPSSVVRKALDTTFADLDQDELIAAALAKRLRRGRDIADEREYARLYRYLLAQGFESDRIRRLLDERAQRTDD
jgi:regulatory protein